MSYLDMDQVTGRRKNMGSNYINPTHSLNYHRSVVLLGFSSLAGVSEINLCNMLLVEVEKPRYIFPWVRGTIAMALFPTIYLLHQKRKNAHTHTHMHTRSPTTGLCRLKITLRGDTLDQYHTGLSRMKIAHGDIHWPTSYWVE